MDQLLEESKDKKTTFLKAIDQFLGYLEGTQKAQHTIKSYRLDLEAFLNYLQTQKQQAIYLTEVTSQDIAGFKNYLIAQQKLSNTQRRQLLTLGKFFSFHAKRKKVTIEMAKKIFVPLKIERIPLIFPFQNLRQKIQQLSYHCMLTQRNRCLLWTLLESGCLVSEIASLKWSDWRQIGSQVFVQFPQQQESRLVPISWELFNAIQEWRQIASLRGEKTFQAIQGQHFIPAGLTPRAIEFLVKDFSEAHAFVSLTPRRMRNSRIYAWLQEGFSQTTIQKWLGLKTCYAFRVYEPILDPALKPAP